MTTRLVHAADLHLDSPLRGLAAYPDAPVERLRAASRQAFSRLVDIAIERHADLMLLAGDVWDGDWPDVGTGLFFAREMGRLQRAGIRVVLLRGNHDAASKITKSVTLPDNVRVLAHRKPESLHFEDLGVVVHGQSFARPDVTDNLAIAYPDAVAGKINIGMLHTALEGDVRHATYAPCKLGDLQAKRYDYWALGHVHEHAVLAASPASAGGTIAFSGVLQGRQVRETGPKGALWVELDEAGARLERLVVDVVRWHVLDIDASGVDSFPDLARTIAARLGELLDTSTAAASDVLVALRLRILGRSPLHGRLLVEQGKLRDETLAQIAAVAPDRVFLEKIECATQPVLGEADAGSGRDAVADLRRILANAAADAHLLEEIQSHLVDMWNQLPGDVRRALEEDEGDPFRRILEGTLSEIVPEACDGLVAIVTNGDDA